ncbi:MAG: bifunctional nicotinamidase/pyrazinamidase [Rhizobiaceae bacterium]|nr:bifunctional nicotinamidase/pyrazinamidase [Rhizobiaceae bacterium]
MKNNAALLMIDIQTDFCPGGALAVNEGDAVVPLANKLQQHFEITVPTQDWHPSDHSSFADNHEGGEPFSLIDMPYGPQVLWPRHCVIGSNGAEFHTDLETDSSDMIIRKGFRSAIDSYSAFFENDKTTQTGLTGYLREREANAVYLVGLALDFCVCYSAVDAAKQGFEATVITDACRAIDLDGSLDNAMTEMKNAGVNFASSGDFL